MSNHMAEATSAAERGAAVGNGTAIVGFFGATWSWMQDSGNGMAIGALAAILGLVINLTFTYYRRRDDKWEREQRVQLAKLEERRKAKEFRLRMRREYGSNWAELTHAQNDEDLEDVA